MKQALRETRRIWRAIAILMAVIAILDLVLITYGVSYKRLATERAEEITEYELNMKGATARIVQLETEIESRNRQ